MPSPGGRNFAGKDTVHPECKYLGSRRRAARSGRATPPTTAPGMKVLWVPEEIRISFGTPRTSGGEAHPENVTSCLLRRCDKSPDPSADSSDPLSGEGWSTKVTPEAKWRKSRSFKNSAGVRIYPV